MSRATPVGLENASGELRSTIFWYLSRETSTNSTSQTMKDVYLILHFIGLAMGLGTSFANLFLGISLSKLPREEAMRISMHTSVLVKMGQIGLALLILSGVLLLIPEWEKLSHCAFFLTKMALVAILTYLIFKISGHIQDAKIAEPEVHLAKIPLLGKLAFVISILIVVLAVLVFH